MTSDSNIVWQGVDYPLRLTFKAIRKVERETGKSVMLIKSNMVSDVCILLAACANITEDEALELLQDVGLPDVAVALNLLIINTFDPEKKPAAAAETQPATPRATSKKKGV